MNLQHQLGLLRPIMMLKHFLKNSKNALKKSKKRLFFPPKRLKNIPVKRSNFDGKS